MPSRSIRTLRSVNVPDSAGFTPCRLLQLLVISACLLFAGCHKTVLVTVTEADAIAANKAAQFGDEAFDRKDYYAALIKYLESVQFNPNNVYVNNRLGITYAQLMFYQQAANVFRRSIELNPKYSFSYNNLGTVFLAQKDLGKAEKYFKKAISLKHDEASFHMNLGSLYLEKRKPEKALAEWRKALAIDPNVLAKSTTVATVGGLTSPTERHYYMACLLAGVRNVEGTIKSLQSAIAEGFEDIDRIRQAPDFDPVRNDPRFIAFLDESTLMIKLRSGLGLPEQPGKRVPRMDPGIGPR